MSRVSYFVGRFSGVHRWPVLGVPRGLYRLLQNLGEAYDHPVEEMRGSFGTEDFREGVVHFLEKRTAAFPGR